MPTIGSITKTIRINPSDLEVIEGIMKKEKTSWSGAVHKIIEDGGVHPKAEAIKTETMKEITEMAHFFNVTVDDFMNGVLSGLTEGNLTVEKGMVVGTPKMQLDEFIDACHERGLEPQETLDRTTVTLRRGK